MNELIGFTIAGLVAAGLYAIVACGLTLTYTTTGIFNWAHGALVAVGAFAYWQLTVEWGLPEPLAIAICLLVIGPVFGYVLEIGIMHRLEGTSEATRMVVTLALLLGLIAGLTWVWDPSIQRNVPRFFNGDVVTIAGQRFPYSDIAIIVIALAVAVAVRTLLYRTRRGVEMRATVDDRRLALLHGVPPTRTAGYSWALGSSLAMLAGVLVAPRAALSATTLALLIVNAYAAAVIGRLRSLPMTFVGALILGLATGYAQGYLGTHPTLAGQQYLSGLVGSLPVVMLFVALQFLPERRLRGSRSTRVKEVSERPTWPGSLVLAGAIIVIAVAMAPLLAPGDLNTMTKVWGLAIIALSLVPLIGYAGRLSVCPLAFGAVGAIVAAHLGGGPVALCAAVAVAAAVGALVSLSAIRLSGLYLALATAAFAVLLDNWIFRLPAFTAVVRVPFTDVVLYRHHIDLFQGGNLAAERPEVFGWSLHGDHAFFVFGAVVTALAVLVVAAVRRSEFGRRLIALKDSPLGYATLGRGERVTTMAVFALSAGIAGLGGALYSAAIQRPAPDVFSFFDGLGLLLAVVIVGVNSIGSAALAGLFVGGPTLANLFPSLSQLSSTLIGTAGIGIGSNPNGLIPSEARPRWEPVRRTPVVLGVGLGIVVVAYVATLLGALTNWWLVGVLLAVYVFLPTVAKRVGEGVVPREVRDATIDGLSGPPELLGLDGPLTRDDLDRVDEVLGWPTTGVR